MGGFGSTAAIWRADAGPGSAHAVLHVGASCTRGRSMVSPARPLRVLRTALLPIAIAACASPAPRGAASSATNRAERVDDTTRLARMEREARALVRTSGCDAASSCRTAPVGWRACGGPRSYVVYCAASTDTV